MTGFVAQPDSFPPAARQLRACAADLVTGWSAVRAQSLAVRFGRGDDVLSPLIQVSLEGAVALVEDCLSSCAEALSDFADGLEEMGRTYREIDDASTALFEATGGR